MNTLCGHVNWNLILPTLALVAVIGFGIARVVDAATSVDYAGRATMWGPIVPGTFHTVARGPVPGGEIVVYTVRRPHRQGLGVASFITHGRVLFGAGNISGGESYGPISPRQHGIVASATESDGAPIVSGYLLDRRIVSVSGRLLDGRHVVKATATPAHGFYLVFPSGTSQNALALTFLRRDGSTVRWP